VFSDLSLKNSFSEPFRADQHPPFEDKESKNQQSTRNKDNSSPGDLTNKGENPDDHDKTTKSTPQVMKIKANEHPILSKNPKLMDTPKFKKDAETSPEKNENMSPENPEVTIMFPEIAQNESPEKSHALSNNPKTAENQRIPERFIL